jgi:ribonuclease-3
VTPSTTSSPASDSRGGRTLLPVDGLDELADRLGRPDVDRDLLASALVHRSWVAEHPGHESNERLEFLGDAVLGLVVTDFVFRAYGALSEGELTDIRKAVVNSVTLAEIAVELELGPCLLVGKGEEQSGGRHKPSILADAVEAVIGAVYLSDGVAGATDLVMRLVGERISGAHSDGTGGQDYKSRLQELTARRFEAAPRYVVDFEGPDHARLFFVTVEVAGREWGRGEGRSKKQAEQAAARAAWVELVADIERDDAAQAAEEGSGGA